ncbi:MAG: patatin-like phospholipase family protein, partial [Planctomycetota bacterium]
QSEEIVSEALKPLVDATPARKEKLFTIRVVNDRLANPSTRLDLLSSRDFKIHKTDHDSDSICRRSEGIERVVHHLRGVSIGLALGGGAARGMAHLGVLQVLQESGIVIDRLSGTSAGALTGVLYSAGYSASALAEYFAHDLKPAWYYRMLPHGDAIYMLCKYRLGGWDNLLRRYLQDWRLEQLAIPTSVVAADLIEARPVIRRSGDATDAILESINLPGLSRPICRDGMALVDGGVFNVVPADVLVGQDSNVVIASNVAARIMKEFAGNKPGMSTDQMRVPSSYETAARVKTVQDRSLRAVGGRAADIVIEPDVSRVKLTDFKMAIDIAKLGLTSAQAALPAILRKLHAIDPQLFPQTSAGTVKRNAA